MNDFKAAGINLNQLVSAHNRIQPIERQFYVNVLPITVDFYFKGKLTHFYLILFVYIWLK